MFIDTHCHLDWEDYQNDFPDIMQRAKGAGVERVVTIGVDEESNRRTSALVKFPGIYRCVGIHPEEVLKPDFSDEKLTQMMVAMQSELDKESADNRKIVGIGECGLDYYCIDRAEGIREAQKDGLMDMQKELFERQILMAIKYGLPLTLHVRDDGKYAYDDVVALLGEYFGQGGYEERAFSFSAQELITGQEAAYSVSEGYTDAPLSGDKINGVLHCVSGSVSYVQLCLEMGFMVSFAGNLTYKNADNLIEIAQSVPLDRIVIETDGPFLSPVPYRGKRNEPAYVIETAKKLAEIKNVSLQEIEAVTTQNAIKLFGF